MQCPRCGGEVPEDASFCKHCGGALQTARGGGAGQWPDETPPSAVPAQHQPWPAPGFVQLDPPSPPPRGGGRGLLIALIVVVVILLLAAAAVAAVLVIRSDTSDGSSSITDVAITTPPEPPPSSTGSTAPPTASTTTLASSPGDDYAGGEWVEMDVSGPAGDIYLVVVSDETAVFAKEDSLFALDFASGRLQQIPTRMESVGMPDIDGRQLVWWEGTYGDDLEEWTDEGIFAFLLPDGPPVRLAGKEGSPGFPLIAGGYVTWTEAHPSAYSPDEIWEFPIRGVRIGGDGRPAGETELLVPAPTAFVLGDSIWAYDLSPTYLAWEQHDDAGGTDVGSYVRNLRTGDETYLGPDSWRPSLAGTNIAYWGLEGLYVRDLASGAERLVDAEGDWPALAESYVAYLRPFEHGDSYGWEIVTQGLGDGSEQVLGEQTNPPWFGSDIAVAPHHLAYVDDENRAHVFERR